MKRSTILPMVLLFAAACTDAPTSPAMDLAPQFSATTDNVPFEFGPTPVSGVISCTGEAADGWTASKGHTRATTNDNVYTGSFHSQYQLELVGQVTGRKYNGQGVTNQKLQVGPGSDQVFRVHNKLIAQGEDGTADDFTFTLVVRLHIAPDGTIRQDVDSMSIECK